MKGNEAVISLTHKSHCFEVYFARGKWGFSLWNDGEGKTIWEGNFEELIKLFEKTSPPPKPPPGPPDIMRHPW